MKTKLCYVISDIDASHLLESNIKFLDAEKYQIDVIFIGPKIPLLYETLKEDGFSVRYYKCRGKIDLFPLTLKLVKAFGEIKPDIVHTHLFHATIAGLTAAKMKGVKNRINTRHHSVEAHLYHPHAVYYDKYVNALATHIVAITGLVADILIDPEKVPPEKVSVVRHGFDWKYFEEAIASPENLKEKYGLTEDYPVVGVISRHIHWKGIQFIIPAFKELLRKYPKAKLVLANATGSYQPEILKLLEEINPERYCIIEFERKVFDLYKSFDVFVHTPIGKNYEAFGQVYVEALAMGVPSVFTLSGVANDFIKDRFNALVVPFEDSNAILKALFSILEDSELKGTLIENGKISARENFHVCKMIAGLDRIYQQERGFSDK